MEIFRREGVRLFLTSISRTVKAGDGTDQTVTCRDGGPEFDAYAAERIAEKKTTVTSTMPKGLIAGLNDIRTRDLQARMDRAFDGVLHARYGRWSFIGRVPVQQAGPSGSVNMYEHISQNIEDIPQAIVPMLKNFDFFTVQQKEAYTQTHPRRS